MPIVPQNQYKRKGSPDYVLRDTEDNMLVMNCLFRQNGKNKKDWHAEKTIDNVIIKRWVKALRSGEYLQEKYSLKSTTIDNKFSALGLLCEITQDITGGKWHGNRFELNGEASDWLNDTSCPSLPEFVAKRIGITNFKYYYTIESGKSNQLYQLNKVFDFNQLADIIENEYKTK